MVLTFGPRCLHLRTSTHYRPAHVSAESSIARQRNTVLARCRWISCARQRNIVLRTSPLNPPMHVNAIPSCARRRWILLRTLPLSPPAHVNAVPSCARHRWLNPPAHITAESSCACHWCSLFVRCEQLVVSAGWTLASGAVLYPATRGTCRRWSGLEFQVVHCSRLGCPQNKQKIFSVRTEKNRN